MPQMINFMIVKIGHLKQCFWSSIVMKTIKQWCWNRFLNWILHKRPPWVCLPFPHLSFLVFPLAPKLLGSLLLQKRWMTELFLETSCILCYDWVKNRLDNCVIVLSSGCRQVITRVIYNWVNLVFSLFDIIIPKWFDHSPDQHTVVFSTPWLQCIKICASQYS